VYAQGDLRFAPFCITGERSSRRRRNADAVTTVWDKVSVLVSRANRSWKGLP